MSDAPAYWSPEFVSAFVDAVNEDERFQKSAASFSDTVVLRCLGTPSGEDVEASYHFEKGEITAVDLWTEDTGDDDFRAAPFDKKAALARATAPYAIWVKLDKGEMNALQALASPEYTVEGPKLKIMANMNVLEGMSRVAANVDKTY